MRGTGIAFVLVWLVGCGGDGDDGGGGSPDAAVAGCGDNMCSAGETNASCPADCPCTPQPNDSCTGENVCVGDSCVSAFGRNYQVVIADGTMTPMDTVGDTWDAAGGLPDPFVVLTLNGTVLGMSSAKQDTLSPVWNEGVTTVIAAGSTFTIDVFDEDLTVDDEMFSCGPFALTADYLRTGGVQCSGSGAISAANVTVYFVRQ